MFRVDPTHPRERLGCGGDTIGLGRATNGALDRFNAASPTDAADLVDGVYEGARWAAEAAVAARPLPSVAALKLAMVRAVRRAPRDARLALFRARRSVDERVDVATESADERATFCRLTAAYEARFGWPFVVAVHGPRGTGLDRRSIVAALERRAAAHPDDELDECLRQLDRIAESRIDERFAAPPARGEVAWDRAAGLARFSDPGFAERGELTVTYLTDAHRACADTIAAWMREAGFDEVGRDAVGNVVGLYRGTVPNAPRLATGSHFDTVRNAGPHDGRLGILVPIASVEQLHRTGRRLPFAIEVIAFAEEEGQRFHAGFIGSRAVVGTFDFAWLDVVDADGVKMRDAMERAGLPASEAAIAALARDPADYLGFVEVHIEQGPVLNALGLPLGVVTSINGGVRFRCEVAGVASHAGTTPMDRRRDAVAAVAELALHLERRAASIPELVGTMGIVEVPGGSTNVVPGRCRFTLDIRATTDEVRDACIDDVLAAFDAICARRGVAGTVAETMRAAACPSAPAWQARWERAVASLGLPIHRMPSGAGHDAMKLHEIVPQAMLFVRGEHGGISHNPLESTTADDIGLAIDAFDALLEDLAAEAGGAQ